MFKPNPNGLYAGPGDLTWVTAVLGKYMLDDNVPNPQKSEFVNGENLLWKYCDYCDDKQNTAMILFLVCWTCLQNIQTTSFCTELYSLPQVFRLRWYPVKVVGQLWSQRLTTLYIYQTTWVLITLGKY